MGNKGIAIRTILLLLIGVLVAGIVIYVAYRYFSGSTLSEHECRAKLISWCSTCAVANYSTTLTMGQEIADCANIFSSGWAGTDDCVGSSGKSQSAVIALCQNFI